ncbi:MAG: tRNA (adenosine(37)-N6)-threonylcarbamoyltransferase complex dimerization subunit type 1 TsaB [Parafilimonas sp.]
MSLLLNIDTATEQASVCVSNDEEILAIEHNTEPINHATFIQSAIRLLLSTTNYQLASLCAIAVSAGPGSYTGLRVGLSTVKGLCYALNKPLILINTLEVMALAAIQHYQSTNQPINQSTLFRPMIDARRMEVFTALYDGKLNIINSPEAIILHENIFDEELKYHTIIFAGSGSKKASSLIKHSNIICSPVIHNASHLVPLALRAYNAKDFADLAYCEPFYLKTFYNTQTQSFNKE